MAGVKLASSSVLESLLVFIRDKCTQFQIHVQSSSSPLVLAGNASASTDCLCISTCPSYPTTSNLSFGASGLNQYMTIAACSSDVVIHTGMAANVTIVVGAASSEVIYATTCTTQDLTATSKCNIGAWSITVNQPT